MTSTTPSSSDHLTAEQLEEIGRRFDEIRATVLASLGDDDAAYIRGLITTQRRLEVAGRALLALGVLPPAWVAGTSALTLAKVLENMEIGHNVLHGQWDWLRDPEIHSTTWDWDHASPAAEWKITHNYEHHTFTNVVGRDRDVGYDVLRLTELQEWKPSDVFQPLVYLAVATFFEQAIAFHDLEISRAKEGVIGWDVVRRRARGAARKVGMQAAKDYVFWPMVVGPSALPMLAGSITANLARNWWSNVIIMCGHFPDGVETFTEDRLDGETKGQWYVRQLLGSGNITGGPLFHVMSGNLSHQIEHHLFPDVPSNRYAEIAPQVREVCEEFGLGYTTGRLSRQYGSFVRKMFRYAVPTRPVQAVADVVRLPQRAVGAVAERAAA